MVDFSSQQFSIFPFHFGKRARRLIFSLISLISLLLIFLLTSCQSSTNNPTLTPDSTRNLVSTTLPQLATPLSQLEMERLIPALAERRTQFTVVLATNQPVLTHPLTTADETAAQQLALESELFQANFFDPLSGAPLRNEMMVIRPTLPSDLNGETAVCAEHSCYRVEMYNYPFNKTIIAIVDLTSNLIRNSFAQIDIQPDLNPALVELANQIAIHSPEVQTALGLKPNSSDATMSAVKTALNGSRCERSQHLCVAPTFIIGDQALFAIVDLTDEQLVGVRWSELGSSGAVSGIQITERQLQNELVMSLYCEQINQLAEDGWEMDYLLTSSDGLQISNLQFNGRSILNSAKLVDWHVSYSEREGFGYSDAIGCPQFSAASIIAYNGPYTEPIIDPEGSMIGFTLIQDFLTDGWPRPCHYRYQQRFEFYKDGRFRIMGGNLGRGCGNDAVYRPVLRIDMHGSSNDWSEWDGQSWVEWATEGWTAQETTAYTTERYQFRINDADGAGYYLQPGEGNGGNERGDNAFIYLTRKNLNSDEGATDLLTIGPCCNQGYEQGPEKFINDEPIDGADLIIWYVAQLENEATAGNEFCWADIFIEDGDWEVSSWPCYFGPIFVPIK